MPQQLQLFSETLSSQDDSTDLLPTDLLSTERLLNETKLLFRHQGSNAELIERISIAVRVIKSLCEKSDVGQSNAHIGG